MAVRVEAADVGVARIDAGDAEEVEREGAMRAFAAAGEALRNGHAADRHAVLVDALAVILNEADAPRDAEDAARGDRQEVRRLRKLLEELGVGAEDGEGVFERGVGEEAAVRIDHVVAAVPEER